MIFLKKSIFGLYFVYCVHFVNNIVNKIIIIVKHCILLECAKQCAMKTKAGLLKIMHNDCYITIYLYICLFNIYLFIHPCVPFLTSSTYVQLFLCPLYWSHYTISVRFWQFVFHDPFRREVKSEWMNVLMNGFNG